MHGERLRRLPAPALVWQYSGDDARLVLLSLVHGAVLAMLVGVALPSAFAVAGIVSVAIGLWWGSNTVAHNFLHRPFFCSEPLNRAYALYLSVLLGVPQALWRERHLAHHARRAHRLRLDRELLVQVAAVLGLWAGLAVFAAGFAFAVYLPGFALGLVLCQLQGHFEHSPATTSHYGRLYNRLFFNDGYHVEHHANPDCHWTRLPALGRTAAASALPPVLRWLGYPLLERLERLVLRVNGLQALVIARHRRAIARLLADCVDIGHITIVGGGLFPRSVIVLRSLFPRARIRVIDASADNIETARRYLERIGIAAHVDFLHARFVPEQFGPATDLLVLPLSLIGDRAACSRQARARHVLVHEWLWQRQARRSVVVAPWLLKRVSLVENRCQGLRSF